MDSHPRAQRACWVARLRAPAREDAAKPPGCPSVHCGSTDKRSLTIASLARVHLAGHAGCCRAAKMCRQMCRRDRAAGRIGVFFGMCGESLAGGLHSPEGAATLNLDAEPSRKERGHRGVRPRHPRGRAFGSNRWVPQAARDRVVFCPAPAAMPSVGRRPARERSPRAGPPHEDGVPGPDGSRPDHGGCADTMARRASPGTTGFDAVGLWGWLRVEVPGRPRKTPGKTISADSHEYALAA